MTTDSKDNIPRYTTDEKPILRPIEAVSIIGEDDIIAERTRIDPGAKRACIDTELAEELGIDNPIDEKSFSTASEGDDTRPLVEVSFVLRGERLSTVASMKDREHLGLDFRLGRDEIGEYLVDPAGMIDA